MTTCLDKASAISTNHHTSEAHSPSLLFLAPVFHTSPPREPTAAALQWCACSEGRLHPTEGACDQLVSLALDNDV